MGSGGFVSVCSDVEEEVGAGVNWDLRERWADTSDFWRAAAEA